MYRHIATALFTATLISCDANEYNITQTSQDQLVEPLPGISRAALEAGLVQLPGTIEAEDYSDQNGIRIGETSDTGGSDFVGWVHDDDYTEYTISVPSTGTYTLSARVAGKNNTGQIAFSVDGKVGANMTVTPTGNWDRWKTLTTTMQLSSGEQTLRLTYSGGSGYLININWLTLESTGDQPEEDTPESNELNNSNWIVSSNFNTDDAYLAIDGRDSTRWTTRRKQTNGQEFYIDMRGNKEFDRIVLDSSSSDDDYPRNYTVDVSTNGSNWTEVAAGTGTSNGNTVIDFVDQNASYIRISQNGSTSRNWWSIHELSVFVGSSEETEYEPPEEEEEENEPTNPPGTHEDIVKVIDVVGRNPGGVGWADSYSVGDQCYMYTNFDHDIGTYIVDTPRGKMTIRELYDLMPTGPGISGRPIYNDIQCGNGPANTASDETDCPGLVDSGIEGCGHIGPKWDLSRI